MRNLIMPVALCLALTACGSDDAPPDEGAPDGGGGGGGGDRGSVTLTIGEETWTFDNFSCFVGADVTSSTEYPFNTNTIAMIDGARIQLQAEYRDLDDEGNLSGDSVVHTIYIRDIDNFEAPTIHFESTSADSIIPNMPPPGGTVIEINGGSISATGMFDDKLTEDDFTQVAGSLEGRCAS